MGHVFCCCCCCLNLISAPTIRNDRRSRLTFRCIGTNAIVALSHWYHLIVRIAQCQIHLKIHTKENQQNAIDKVRLAIGSLKKDIRIICSRMCRLPNRPSWLMLAHLI